MTDIEKAKKLELKILKHIDEFCKKNNINYCLAYGTLLGCIRHKGFIPWDDDIDIYMLKKDYDKFKQLYKNEENKPYFFQNYETEKNTPFVFSKIRLNGTKFISKEHMSLKIHQGIFIDIFPLYKTPKNDVERKKHFNRIELWRQLFIAKTIPLIVRESMCCKDWLLLGLRRILHFLLLLVSKDYIFFKMEKEAQKYENLDAKDVYFTPIGASKDMKICYEDIFPLVEKEFEGQYFQVPVNWDKILRACYGKYMQLPPEDKRITHRPVILEVDEKILN